MTIYHHLNCVEFMLGNTSAVHLVLFRSGQIRRCSAQLTDQCIGSNSPYYVNCGLQFPPSAHQWNLLSRLIIKEKLHFAVSHPPRNRHLRSATCATLNSQIVPIPAMYLCPRPQEPELPQGLDQPLTKKAVASRHRRCLEKESNGVCTRGV